MHYYLEFTTLALQLHLFAFTLPQCYWILQYFVIIQSLWLWFLAHPRGCEFLLMLRLVIVQVLVPLWIVHLTLFRNRAFVILEVRLAGSGSRYVLLGQGARACTHNPFHWTRLIALVARITRLRSIKQTRWSLSKLEFLQGNAGFYLKFPALKIEGG
jgi:hypothetical protein